MSLVSRLNTASCSRKAVNGADLTLNFIFSVEKVRVVQTRYTKDQILLDISDTDGTPLAMWVPKRYCGLFSAEDINAVNDGKQTLKFKVSKIEEYKTKKTPVLEFLW